MKLSRLPKGTLKSSNLPILWEHLTAEGNWRHCALIFRVRRDGPINSKSPRDPISTTQSLGVSIIPHSEKTPIDNHDCRFRFFQLESHFLNKNSNDPVVWILLALQVLLRSKMKTYPGNWHCCNTSWREFRIHVSGNSGCISHTPGYTSHGLMFNSIDTKLLFSLGWWCQDPGKTQGSGHPHTISGLSYLILFRSQVTITAACP